MTRHQLTIPTILCVLLISSCASISKKDCQNANWETIGYTEGTRGLRTSTVEKYNESCAKHGMAPDVVAYQRGWDIGIRSYCTEDSGYTAGFAGLLYRDICPADLAPAYRSGWEQGNRGYCTTENGYGEGVAGRAYRNICPTDMATSFHAGWERGIRDYCSPENALQRGLKGGSESHACPVDLAEAYRDFYRLGSDVRKARKKHVELERKVEKAEEQLALEKDAKRQEKKRHTLERLEDDEMKSDMKLIALEACMSDSWYNAGYQDGEEGVRSRAREIGNVCRSYGITADRRGYRDGWSDGKYHRFPRSNRR